VESDILAMLAQGDDGVISDEFAVRARKLRKLWKLRVASSPPSRPLPPPPLRMAQADVERNYNNMINRLNLNFNFLRRGSSEVRPSPSHPPPYVDDYTYADSHRV